MKQAQFEPTFEGWRAQARCFLQDALPPDAVNWNCATPSLFTVATPSLFSEVAASFSSQTTLPRDSETAPLFSGADLAPLAQAQPPSSKPRSVPREFIELAELVACARDESRWDLLYRILYRLQFENPHLLKITVDPEINRALLLAQAVRRDIHKMHAFVRFKKSHLADEDMYVAWHKPLHLIVELATPFFARRFGDRRWSIFTPDASAHWNLQNLEFGPGLPEAEFRTQDDWDEVWKTYYKSIFNPARIKIKAMKLEMSPKYWSTLPEASLIPELIRDSPRRLQEMAEQEGRAVLIPDGLSLTELRARAKSCTTCEHHCRATQTVFGSGPDRASIMIVGEQPGDHEDRQGKPFVGPAGEVLERALRGAGLTRASLYLTNAVKHFKFIEREGGKVRLHQKPSGREMHACKPWLEAEIAQVRPKIIVALGTTAATAVLGRLPKISAERGKLITGLKIAPVVILSWHPSAILRSSLPAEAELRLQQLTDDLRIAAMANQRIPAPTEQAPKEKVRST